MRRSATHKRHDQRWAYRWAKAGIPQREIAFTLQLSEAQLCRDLALLRAEGWDFRPRSVSRGI